MACNHPPEHLAICMDDPAPNQRLKCTLCGEFLGLAFPLARPAPVRHYYILHEIAVDGLPDMEKLVGRVAFIFDGEIVSGWPSSDGLWEANSDVGCCPHFDGVTHWVEFPRPLEQIIQNTNRNQKLSS